MRACVVFDTRFGNTEKIARSLAAGMRDTGVETDVLRSSEAPPDSLRGYDLICVGAPTEAFGPSGPMKDFLARLPEADLAGREGFAFDTKVDWRFSGSAAKGIAKRLEAAGLRMVVDRESAIVSASKSGGTITGATLREGEEERFVEVGRRVGEALKGERAFAR